MEIRFTSGLVYLGVLLGLTGVLQVEIQQDHSFYHIIKREYRIIPFILLLKILLFLHPSYLSPAWSDNSGYCVL